MRYFPIFFDLKGRDVIVVGGGEEALRKIRLLLKTEARINVVASNLHPEIAEEPRVKWLAKTLRPALLDDAALVFAADPLLNEEVAALARARGIPVNVVDSAGSSNFITPSIVDRDPVVVAIGTEGAAPVLGQGIRAKIDALLPARLGELAILARGLREDAAKTVPPGNRRRSFWQEFFFGSIRDAFLAGDEAAYLHAIETTLAGKSTPARGRVSFVAAGSGDPELLTLKAHRKLQEADVIVHDRFAGKQILELARRDAVRIRSDRLDTDDTLVREAKAGKLVVRLFSGKAPTARELAALRTAGIAVDLVPGVVIASDGVQRGRSADIVSFADRNDLREAVLRAAS